LRLKTQTLELKTKLNRMEKIMNKHQTATDVYTVLPTGTGNLLELFAGSRSVGKIGERLGYNVFSIDWKEYEGIDLAIDIGNLTKEDVPFVPDVVWASPDCTTYSIAACSTHRTNSIEPKSDYAKKCDAVNQHFILLINEWLKINPDMVFFIENPRGMLRKMPFMQEFKRHTIWYCQYGDDRAKPTDALKNAKTKEERQTLRSKTFEGMAYAFAEQWGGIF
jgi:site-specific DNA-cytosine methylase